MNTKDVGFCRGDRVEWLGTPVQSGYLAYEFSWKAEVEDRLASVVASRRQLEHAGPNEVSSFNPFPGEVQGFAFVDRAMHETIEDDLSIAGTESVEDARGRAGHTHLRWVDRQDRGAVEGSGELTSSSSNLACGIARV